MISPGEMSSFNWFFQRRPNEQLEGLLVDLPTTAKPETNELVLQEITNREIVRYSPQQVEPKREGLIQKVGSSFKNWIREGGWLIILVMLVSSLLFEPNQEPYFNTAYNYFKKLSQPSPENSLRMGMDEFKLFGTPIALPINQPSEKKIADAPRTYEITFPFWLKGINSDGQRIKTKGNVKLIVVETQQEAEWQVQSFEFGQQTPLSPIEQVGAWLFWSAFGPLLIIAELVFDLIEVLSNFPEWLANGCLLIINFSFPIVLGGYLAYVFFGSILAAIIGAGVHVPLAWRLQKWIMH